MKESPSNKDATIQTFTHKIFRVATLDTSKFQDSQANMEEKIKFDKKFGAPKWGPSKLKLFNHSS